jgi:hypothetical protein
MQNTRQGPGGAFKTSTAGIQYVANPQSSNQGRWYVWEQAGEGTAAWQYVISQTLQAGSWYTLAVEADFGSNRYRWFSIQGDNLNKTEDLADRQIAREPKGFTRESFVITLEGENAWSNCGTVPPTNYKVYYDDIALTQFITRVYLPLVRR